MSALARLDFDAPTSLSGLQRLGESVMPQLSAALPRVMGTDAPRLLRSLLTECQRSPALLDCSPKSLLGGLIQVAQLGLELGGPAGQAYLLPFKKKGEDDDDGEVRRPPARPGDKGKAATLVIGYKGYIALAHRSNQVARISLETVRAKDVFRVVLGSDKRIIHEPDLSDEGVVAPAVGYYADVKMLNGGGDFEYLTMRQAELYRDAYALAKKGPWLTNFHAMARKSACRQLAKRLPLSVQWVAAASLDEMADERIPQRLEALLPVGDGDDGPPADAGSPDALRSRLARAAGSTTDFTPGDAAE